MGASATISAKTWPRQASFLNKRVRVCFNYDTSAVIEGTVVRDDAETPGKMIIRLDDGRHVLSTECQYQPV